MEMEVREEVELLMQGTEYGDAELAARMASELEERVVQTRREGRPLRVYCGFDPRTSDLHLGHMVPIRKLRQFQELGHEVTFLVGTGTALIGDPSDKTGLRAAMSRQEAMENGRTYAEQAFRMLDPGKTRVRFNHEWLEGLQLEELSRLAAQFTIQQILSRENFHARWQRGDPVYLHETLYSLMQGYDAFTLQADVQVGGSDQLFNIVTASRRLMSALGARPNVALIVGILPGTDGSVKMSKSLGNHIRILASPQDMYGKVMSVPDTAMRSFFDLATPLPPADVAVLFRRVDSGLLHPRDLKMRLAREIVSAFHSPNEARTAEEEFVRVFQRSETPQEVPELRIAGPVALTEALVSGGLLPSRSEARRLITQRGIRVDGVVVESDRMVEETCLVQVGKRRFLRVSRGPSG